MTFSEICIFTISQTTKFPAPPSSPKEIMFFTIHSICTGDSFTLYGFTLIDSKGVKPDLINSLIPSLYSVLERDVCSTIGYDTTLMTTSLVEAAFCSVCFIVLFLTRLAGEKIAIGGFALKTLKKENGLKFGRPLLSIVLTRQ